MRQRRTILWTLWFCAIASLALAQQGSTFQQLTVDNTSGGVAIASTTLTNALGQQMNYCEGRLETAEIRFRDDGGTVTSSSGTLIEPGDVWKAFSNATAQATKFIRTGSSSGALDVRCYLNVPRN